MRLQDARIAIVHEWMVHFGGGSSASRQRCASSIPMPTTSHLYMTGGGCVARRSASCRSALRSLMECG
jgi:hypothetical protein